MSWKQINQSQHFINPEIEKKAKDPQNAKATLVFLGTGASTGVPTYYCDCKACKEAEENPEARRTCSSIAVIRSETTLIDTTPDVHIQLRREGIMDIHRVLFTHEHFDHIGGLPQLEYYSRLRSKRPIEIYCNHQTASYLKTHYDFMSDVLSIKESVEWESQIHDGITYTPIPAKHCPGALGYLIEVPEQYSHNNRKHTVGYLPDTSRPIDETLERLQNIDTLIIDATFTCRNWMKESHLDIDSAIELADELNVGQAFLTHLSMQFDEPMTLEELKSKLSHTRCKTSLDGMKLEL